MKRVVVCGDSFMSPRTQYPKKHFAEIFADNLNFDLVCYSRSGFSNGGISIQIETAIRQNPNLILFNTTNFDRIEFDSGISLSNYNDLFFVENLGDTNIHSCELSDTFYTFNKSKRLISTNLNGLLSKQPDEHWQKLYDTEMNIRFPDWEGKLESINLYLKHLYSEQWKQQMDRMVMYATLHRLHLSKIPYIFVHDWLGILNSEYNPYWMEEKNTVAKAVNEIRMKAVVPKDIGFHLSFEDSKNVADILISHYQQYF
jgi:hypothetical protein